jgi:hypothetical protein
MSMRDHLLGWRPAALLGDQFDPPKTAPAATALRDPAHVAFETEDYSLQGQAQEPAPVSPSTTEEPAFNGWYPAPRLLPALGEVIKIRTRFKNGEHFHTGDVFFTVYLGREQFGQPHFHPAHINKDELAPYNWLELAAPGSRVEWRTPTAKELQA